MKVLVVHLRWMSHRAAIGNESVSAGAHMVGTGPARSVECVAVAAAIGLLTAAVIGGATMVRWSNFFRAAGNAAVTLDPPGETPPSPTDGDPFAAAREAMVNGQLRSRDITDPRVLAAMGRVPRERFVSAAMQGQAYDDHPLPIGLDQTISQPYIVALMTQLARPAANSRALEVGTGSGYQAAVLAELCKEVYSIEILNSLADGARQRLAALGYKNITVRAGDGYQGWPEHAPFDVILVTAAPPQVPQPLVDQLAPGGRLVIPVGGPFQQLLLIEKGPDGAIRRQGVAPVQFVPMTGQAQQ